MTIRSANRLAFVLGSACIVGWFLLITFAQPTFIADERTHFQAGVEIMHGRWPVSGWLPMFPGFHALVGGVMSVGGESLTLARATCAALAIAALAAWSRAAYVATPALAPAKTLLFALNTVWLPFSVLVYTESAAVLAVGAAALLHFRRQYVAAAIALALGALVRQTNLFWAILLAIWLILERLELAAVNLTDGHSEPPDTSRESEPLQRSWAAAARRPWHTVQPAVPYLLLLIGALIYAVLNPSALRPTAANQLKLNPAQLYLYLLIVAFVFLPLWISCVRRNWAERYQPALARGRIAGGLFVAVGVAILGFTNPHPWNGDPNYLRNVLLVAMDTQVWLRAIVALVIVGLIVVWAGFVASQPRPAASAATWALGVAFVEMHWLAEPRYAILPLMLATLQLQCQRRTLWQLVAWNAALAVVLCGFVVRHGNLDGGVP